MKKTFWRFAALAVAPFLVSCSQSNDLALTAEAVETAQSELRDTKVEQPNILFIFADDLTYESIGALNNPEVHTPNIDRLAQQGVYFNQAYNQGAWGGAVCQASRTMLNTGKSLWRAHEHEKAKRASRELVWQKKHNGEIEEYSHPKESEEYWAQFMHQAGYETYFTGKWHVVADAEQVFDVSANVRGGMPNQTDARYARKFIEGAADTWSPYDKSQGGFWKGGKHWSEVVADDALDFIDTSKSSEKPFFMYLAFNAAHDPRQAPKSFVDMYPLEDIALPVTFQPEYPYATAAGADNKLRDEQLAPFPRTPYSVKVNRQEYYAIITHMDQQIGRILDALEQSGKAKDTYIIFTADHGLAAGDHGFLGKQNMYDRSIRVPMIVAGPGLKQGKKVEEFVYLQDVMPSALELAGVDKPSQVEFNSLMPLARGMVEKGYPSIYGAYIDLQRMIRTKDYKMIIYPDINRVRLYNLKTDPNEMKDLAGDLAYRSIQDGLLAQLIATQRELGDEQDITAAYQQFFAGLQGEEPNKVVATK